MVPLPGLVEIEKLLRVTLATVKVAEPIDWANLVEKLTGASAAMVVKAAQDAAKAAVLSGKQLVTQDNLLQSISEQRRGDSAAHEE
jgi:ATP-dependent 26S proteasome regulatory subunit